MKFLHRLFVLLLCLFCLVDTHVIYGQEDFYYIYDSDKEIEKYEDYREAFSYYENHLDEYDNLLLIFNDQVIHMEYGIVEFKTGEACLLNVEYQSITRDDVGYLNGCYGIDAAYLETSDDGKNVYFMISGDRGYTSIENVILHPYETLKVRPSMYANSEGYLIHKIKTQFDQDYYSYSLMIDETLDELVSGNDYFSYDGHYFYDDFYAMIDDYRTDSHDHSINSDAYYNYFQYLPYRSLSNYDLDELNKYFYDVLKIDGRMNHYNDYDGDGAGDEINRSQLYGQFDSFIAYQYLYGTNAMMMISSAINESSYGRSFSAYSGNNLYQVAAYESETEKNNSRYDSIDNSIYSYSKYLVSSLYSNHLRSDYAGTFYGNKASGINAGYSLDPYLGEKNSAVYFDLDSKLSGKDRNCYALGIITADDVTFYKDQQLQTRLFRLKDLHDHSFIILAEYDETYKIQIDASFDEGYLYDFERSIAYIKKDVFSAILNEGSIHEYDLANIHYDLGEGSFRELQSVDLKYPKANQIPVIIPERDGYVFDGYDENNVAKYRKIKDIEVVSFNETIGGTDIDLNGSIIRVNYEDKTDENIEINTDMLEGYAYGCDAVTIDFHGIKTQQNLSYDTQGRKISDDVLLAIESHDYQYVKDNIGSLKYPLSFAQIRQIDYELKEINDRNYVIKDNSEKYNISISGLDLSLENRNTFNLFDDTYYVVVDNIARKDEDLIFGLASGYGFDKVEGIDISFRFNYQDIELVGPAIVQIAPGDKKNNLVYSVYHLSDDGDIIKCRTTQSENYVQFLINESGPYLLLTRSSVNEYDFEDRTEDLSYENMGFDNHRINISLLVTIVLSLLGIIGIIVYYIFNNKRKKLWKDFRRSLRTAGYAQEEKPKN